MSQSRVPLRESDGQPVEPLHEPAAIQVLEAVAGSDGREWDVILIEAGVSRNGNYYPAPTLAAAASLFEGVPAFVDHATADERRARPERSVRNKAGVFRNPQYGQFSLDGRMVEAIRARFKVVDRRVREQLVEAHALGEPEFVGLSIDAEGRVSRKEHAGRLVNWVEAITRVASVDVVTDPAAGGRIMRLVAGNLPTGVDAVDPEELQKLIAEQVGAAVGQAVAQLKEAMTPAAKVEEPAAAEPAATADESMTEAAAVIQEARRLLAEAKVDKALAAATGLSEVGRQFVREGLLHAADTRELSEAQIGEAITRQQDYEAALRPVAPLTLGGRVQTGDSAHDKMVKALIGWFTGAPEDGVKPFSSLREAYCRWKGLDYFDQFNAVEYIGDFSTRYDSAIHHGQLKESLSTASWGQIFADVQYLMVIRSYQNNPMYARWRALVSDLESVPDFQTRHWARIGGYGDLSTVAEQATYQPLTSPGDEEVTYTIAKRGGLDDITMEMLLGDRVNRIRQIPAAMARSAARTLFKFVVNLATTDNPTLDYDSVALYHASHGNTGTAALSVSALNDVRVAMRDQTAFGEANEILGERNQPRLLLIPNELQALAGRVLNPSDAYLASVSNGGTDTTLDPAMFRGAGIEALVIDHFTDATDWFVVADPTQVPTMVVGFLGGQQEPELFVQDQPTVGSVFTADKITYKIRHIYGADVLDHRAYYRNVV